MIRNVIVVGDPPSSGGAVLANGNATFSVGNAGHKPALIGGSVRCDACNSTGIIAKAGGPRRMLFMGEVALENDIVVCKCPQPPKLIATLHHTMHYDDLVESEGEVPPPTNAGGTFAPQFGANEPSPTTPKTSHQELYDEQAQLEAPHIEGVPYYIETMDGRMFSGRTNPNGQLPRIDTDGEEEYAIFWGDEALAKTSGGAI